MRNLILVSGKDSLCTALVQRARRPDIDYEYLFNDTGSDLPEVYDWLNRVEVYLGKPITRIGTNLLDLVESYNGYLPSAKNRYCTRETKIKPMQDYIGKDLATVYYGIRADEPNRIGYDNKTTPNITPVYPLKELGIDLRGVYAINAAAGLKPPTFFWESVFRLVCKKISEQFIRDNLSEWEFDAIFSWRSRTNCFHCFNQQYREWVGLLEHYPDLFWKAEAMEHIGSEFTWNSNGKSLKQIAEEAEMQKQKWVKKIIRIFDGKAQTSLFQDEVGNVDILSVTSCGLYCGK